MVCPNCGQEIAEGSMFCRNCGTRTGGNPMGVICAKCGSRSLPGAEFCAECGAKLGGETIPVQSVCPWCGESLASDAVFCGNCGRPTDGAPVTPAATGNAQLFQSQERKQFQQQSWASQESQGRKYSQQQDWAQPQVQLQPQAKSQPKGSRKMLIVAAAAVILLVVGITGFWKPGFLLDLFRPTAKPENSIKPLGPMVVLDRSRVSVERQMVEQSFCLTVQQILYARLLTEKVARLDDKVSPKEARSLVNKAAYAWKCAAEMTERTQRMANILSGQGQKGNQILQKQSKNKAKPKPNTKKVSFLSEDVDLPLAVVPDEPSLLSWNRFSVKPYFTLPEFNFFSRAYAAGSDIITAKEGTAEWAIQVQAVYDAFPSGQKIAGLTQIMGAKNMREAHEKLVEAGKIIDREGKWDVAKATAKGLGKGVAVVGGVAAIVLVPVGVAGAATALSTGVAAGSTGSALFFFGVGMTATVSGAVSAGIHFSQDLSNKPMTPEQERFARNVDNIALLSNAGNLLINGGKAVGTAVSKVSQAGNNASKLEKGWTFTKEAAKELFAKGPVQEYAGNTRAQILITGFDTYSTMDSLTKKVYDFIPVTDEKGNTGVMPVELPEKPSAEPVKTLQDLTDDELKSTITEYEEKNGNSGDRTDRVRDLEKMQKQPKSDDDWMYWNSNGITKAEYNKIMKSYPNDVRDLVQQRLENYKKSGNYKEELKKRGKADSEKDTTPPFAPKKVAGTYKIPVNGSTITITVKAKGDGITLNYPYYRNNVLKHRTETPASYDAQSGKGTLVNEGSTCSFWFTRTNGKMKMSVGSWSKIKK